MNPLRIFKKAAKINTMNANIVKSISPLIPNFLLKQLGNLYGPFVGSGIKITYLSEDFKNVHVEMPLTWFNKNYVGTHFGGSLYSMVDPFYMLMLINILGPGYIVWDKEATVRFKKPGRGTVRATFKISDEEINHIKSSLAEERSIDFTKSVIVKDDDGNIICEAEKTMYIKKKPRVIKD